MKFYRILFSLAALYNLAFGLWAGFFPLHFFKLFELTPPQYPAIWACVGMVVGIYCIAYAYVAWKPEQGDVLIWIGFIGKLLGPFGWLHAVVGGELPARTFPLTLFNDLIWWFPFLFYLLRNQRLRGRIVTAIVVFAHLVACFGLLFLQEGMEFNPSFASRQQWVMDHTSLWTFVWFFWVISSLSLPAFLASWILSLHEKKKPPSWIWLSLAVASFGVLFDLSAETLYITWLPSVSRTLSQFEGGVRAYSLLSAAAANGLYCVAGLFLSVVSWKFGFLRGPKAAVGFLMWCVGLGLTLTALLNHRLGIIITAAGTMILFIPCAAWVGWRFVLTSPPLQGGGRGR